MNINMIKAIIYQCQHYGFVNSFFIDKNGKGIFSPRSHYNKDGTEKVRYGHAETAERAVAAMTEKYGRKHMRAYKCGFCDGYHIGNARR